MLNEEKVILKCKKIHVAYADHLNFNNDLNKINHACTFASC